MTGKCINLNNYTNFINNLDACIYLKKNYFNDIYFCRFDEITKSYETLFHATHGFSDSCLIGSGGYSKVFKAKLKNQTVAIKRMERDINQYLNEIDQIIKFKHVNLLPLIAISVDKHPCIIYEFMENGSLLDCIACKVWFWYSLLIDFLTY